MSAFNACSSILSPSCKSMARRVLPSRLELKRPEGSSNEAPLAKVNFTTLLYVSPVQMIPACDHTGAHAPNLELPVLGLTTEMREPKEVECFRFSFPTILTILHREPAKPQQTRVDWPNLHIKDHLLRDRCVCFNQKTSNQPTDKAATVNAEPKSH